ncbi:hypothetical protein FALB51S_02011 [Frigidibacter albus]|uniref:Uncharacterized protein n=1 Tax=Frigidibacter mobilis TaxID=1335048 RepID=A0A159Z2J5_9RHOB|nr:hypothetical protein AKL17_1065 [Frigidibacter mobilis]
MTLVLRFVLCRAARCKAQLPSSTTACRAGHPDAARGMAPLADRAEALSMERPLPEAMLQNVAAGVREDEN